MEFLPFHGRKSCLDFHTFSQAFDNLPLRCEGDRDAYAASLVIPDISPTVAPPSGQTFNHYVFWFRAVEASICLCCHYSETEIVISQISVEALCTYRTDTQITTNFSLPSSLDLASHFILINLKKKNTHQSATTLKPPA